MVECRGRECGKEKECIRTKYVRWLKDMDEEPRTKVRTCVGMTESFPVKMDSH